MIEHTRIETMELIALDTRKEFLYDKSTGLWEWYNRGEYPDTHKGFKTRLEALTDATEPYLEHNPVAAAILGEGPMPRLGGAK